MRNSEITEHVNTSNHMQFLFIPSEVNEAIEIIGLTDACEFFPVVTKMVSEEYRRFYFDSPVKNDFTRLCCWYGLRASKEKLNIFASMIHPGRRVAGNVIFSGVPKHGFDLIGLSKEELKVFSEYLKYVRKETPQLQWSKENSGETNI
jgi:hypothetical protein